MIRSLPTAAACLLLCASAFAGQPPAAVPPDTPSAAYGTQKVHARPRVEISVGGVRVELEKTTLVQLQKSLGGTIAQSGAAREATFGLCYVMREGDRRRRLWLMSDEDMGPDHAIDSALASSAEEGQPMPSNCIEPAGVTSMKVENATVGSPLKGIQDSLGKGSRQKGGWLGYSFGARGGSSDLSEFLFLAIGQAGGVVSDLFVQQTTGKSPE
jgi:hypothetical protein